MSGWADFLRQHRERHVEDLMAFLRIQSVSALSEHRPHMEQAVEWLRQYLLDIGLETARVVPTGGHPAVYAAWTKRPGAPTALIYGHYDVQPVDPIGLWESPPFEPAVRGGRVYARGASDDKGQVLMHLQALEALLRAEGELPVNVKILIEGEEEIGSPNLTPFIAENKAMLEADVVVISDTSMFADGLPTICTGLRGVAALELHVRCARTDLHSGLYGGAAPNAAHAMVELLASMRRGQERVAVPGFYDDVEALSPREREAMARLPFHEADFAQEIGVSAFVGEPDFSVLERVAVRPTLEINGMWGGFQGEGTKTVIPAEAHAKITCRLVPGQDPQKIQDLIADYLLERVPAGAELTVVRGHTARPWKISPDAPAIQAGVEALEEAFGKRAALVRMGGSIPVVESLDAALGVPCVLMGFAPPHSNAHAPNEFFPLDAFETGRRALAMYWRELARAYR